MLYGESKSAGSCGHFKFHTKRDTTTCIAPWGTKLARRLTTKHGRHSLTADEALERLSVERLANAMRRVVQDERRSASLVEEAPAAYRDIGEVLQDEADLVNPVLRLEPMLVLKG